MFGYGRDEKGSHIYLFWIPVTMNRDDKIEPGTNALLDETDDSQVEYMALARTIYGPPVNLQAMSKNLNWNYCYCSTRVF